MYSEPSSYTAYGWLHLFMQDSGKLTQNENARTNARLKEFRKGTSTLFFQNLHQHYYKSVRLRWIEKDLNALQRKDVEFGKFIIRTWFSMLEINEWLLSTTESVNINEKHRILSTVAL